MRSSDIVPNQPVNELLVESVNVVSQQHSVSGNESLGYSPVESLNLGVHFGTAGITVEMDDAVSFQEQVEMVGEFRTVVGLDVSQ